MSDEKKLVSSSKGIGQLLNIGSGPVGEAQPGSGIEEVMAPDNLPIAEQATDSAEAVTVPQNVPVPAEPEKAPTDIHKVLEVPEAKAMAQSPEVSISEPWLLALKKAAPYLIVFLVGLGVFLYFLPDFSVTQLVSTGKLKIETLLKGKPTTPIQDLQKELAGDYGKWIKQFFFGVTDPEIVDMNVDVSGNGLSNFEKFLFDLNPKVYSTRGGMSDGEAIMKGINPWTGAVLSAEQKDLVAKYINPEVVSNRIAGTAHNPIQQKFARYVDPQSPYANGKRSDSNLIAPSTGQPPIDPSQLPNPAVPGQLEIPGLAVQVSVIWTTNVSDFDRDLKKGVVHYPGTAFPGLPGLSYISGHSSGYPWDQNQYKHIFKNLGDLTIGESFSITLQKNNGQRVRYSYGIERRGEYLPDDQTQFQAGQSESVVALSTCWPVGTTDKRLVLFGRLLNTENIK